MTAVKKRTRRPLLVASVGLATLTLTLEGCLSCGNLMSPPASDAGRDASAPTTDAGTAADAGAPARDTGIDAR